LAAKRGNPLVLILVDEMDSGLVEWMVEMMVDHLAAVKDI